jgi:hypothetical protein
VGKGTVPQRDDTFLRDLLEARKNPSPGVLDGSAGSVVIFITRRTILFRGIQSHIYVTYGT